MHIPESSACRPVNPTNRTPTQPPTRGVPPREEGSAAVVRPPLVAAAVPLLLPGALLVPCGHARGTGFSRTAGRAVQRQGASRAEQLSQLHQLPQSPPTH